MQVLSILSHITIAASEGLQTWTPGSWHPSGTRLSRPSIRCSAILRYQHAAVLRSARDDGQLRKLQVAWLTSKPHAGCAGYVQKINDIQRSTMQPGTVHQIPSEKNDHNSTLPFLMKLGIGLLPRLHISRARMRVVVI